MPIQTVAQSHRPNVVDALLFYISGQSILEDRLHKSETSVMMLGCASLRLQHLMLHCCDSHTVHVLSTMRITSLDTYSSTHDSVSPNNLKLQIFSEAVRHHLLSSTLPCNTSFLCLVSFAAVLSAEEKTPSSLDIFMRGGLIYDALIIV